MEPLLLVHMLFVGLWLGCVLTEAIFERALLNQGNDARLILANLHVKVDILVEVPAFTVVAATGVFLAMSRPLTTFLLVKILAAVIAITANIFCVKLVFNRRSHAQTGNWAAFDEVDQLQHKMGAIVLIGILVSIVFGATT